MADFSNSKKLRAEAHRLIPGGSHTYAKGDDQYPELSPGFIARGAGCRVWDVDGNEYIEYGMGLRSVTLGHAYAPVVEAAYRQMRLGANFTRPAPVEVEAARAFLELVPGAEMVKFAKDGSTVNTAAIKLARAYTGRDMVAVCADHPFFSYNDWFIGTTPLTSGIPPVMTSLTVRFKYNDLASLAALFEEYPDRIACVMLEPVKNDDPKDNFLAAIQKLCREKGALLIFDEMITGFRLAVGGGQEFFGITPDLSTFGKAIANGFSVSVLAGRREIMELGGLYHDRERVFLLSTTHGAETHSLAAAIATMQVYKKEGVIERLRAQGARLARGVSQAVEAAGLAGYVTLAGKPCNLVYGTRDAHKKDSQLFRTLFMQELIRHGILGPSFVVSYSHSDDDIDRTIEAVAKALPVYRQALETGPEQFIQGAPVKTVYRRFN